ncbi:MAG: hypothetical protein M1827_006562 [Pycnora praestabilis]|nr:MAG: hypothetical protein M1827_006562 [Pycnora praestabilis]
MTRIGLRTITTSPLSASSLQTAPLQQETFLEGEVVTHGIDGADPHSPAISLWTAPSPSQARLLSSPTIPRSSTSRALGEPPRTPASVPRHGRTPSSIYYTASWGSLHQYPSSSSESKFSFYQHQRQFSSEDIEEISPVTQLNFNHLLAANRSTTEARPCSRTGSQSGSEASQTFKRLRTTAGARPAHSQTEDWIRQYRTGQVSFEQGDWWSDKSEGSDKRQDQGDGAATGISHSKSWLDADERRGSLGEPNSSILSRFAQHRGNTRYKAEDSVKEVRRQRSRKCSQFYDILQDSSPVTWPSLEMAESTLAKSPTASMHSSTRSGKRSFSPDQRSPSRPPMLFEGMTSDGGIQNHASPTPQTPATPSKNKTTPSRVLTGQKLRKRVVWRGKQCTIALPLDEARGKGLGAPEPLKTTDVKERFKHWEDLGYSTETVRRPSEAQSRQVFPDSEDERTGSRRRNYRIRIPDRRDWDAYVHQLKEEKLRALGVSFADDEITTTVSTLYQTRQESASNHMPLPLRPPRLTSSAGSHRTVQYMNPFSPVLTPSSTNASSRVASRASPTPQLMAPHLSHHAHRHSISSFALPLQLPEHQPTPSIQGTWSPQQLVGPRGVLEGSFPAFEDVQIPTAGHASYPGLLFGLQNDSPSQTRMLQHQLHGQGTSRGHQQYEELLTSGPGRLNKAQAYEEEDEEWSWKGHGYYDNVGSQKEIDDAVYHLEESIGRHLDDEDEPILHQPQPLRSGHGSHSSISKLNVQAKEFKFTPSGSFAPNGVAYSEGTPSNNAHSSSHLPQQLTHSDCQGSESSKGVGATLNIAAPAFAPKLSIQPSFPTETLSFSAVGSSFSTDSAKYMPGSIEWSQASGDITGSGLLGSETPSNASQKTFGKMSFDNIVKPSRRSKAIPIVRPDETQNNCTREDDDQDDKSGRIMQNEDQQKRMRHNKKDGDQVPQFYSPVELVAGDSRPQTVETRFYDTNASDKENFGPSGGKMDPVNQKNDFVPKMDPSQKAISIGSLEDQGKAWEPFAFRRGDEAANINDFWPQSPSAGLSSRASSNSRIDLDPELNELFGHQAEHVAAVVGKDSASRVSSRLGSSSSVAERVKKSPLSSCRQDKTSNPSFGIPSESCEAQVGSSQISDALEDSYLASSPAQSSLLQASPATTLRPSEVGSFRAQIPEPQKHSLHEDSEGVDYNLFTQPSFEEIGVVIKDLNKDDSDFSIERSENFWRQATPRRAPIPVFDDPTPAQHRDPNETLRSDAPSPSPRRFQHASHQSFKGYSPKPRQSQHVNMNIDSPIHGSNHGGNRPVSDWGDVFSSTEEAKLEARSQFFDNRVNNIVDGLLQQRLDPIEKTLDKIRSSLSQVSTKASSRKDRRSVSVDLVDSDADDEDDLETVIQRRSDSPRKDRKLEQIKATVLEAISSHKPSAEQSAALADLLEIQQVFHDMKASLGKASRQQTQIDDIKLVVDQVLSGQNRSSLEGVQEGQLKGSDEHLLHRIDGLELQLQDDLKKRRAAEEESVQTLKLLRTAEVEVERQRQSAKDFDRKLRDFDDKQHQALVHSQMRTALLEGAQENMQKTNSNLSEEVLALEGTLAEYRLSSDKWRADLQDAGEETRDLNRRIDTLKLQMEESIRIREGLRGKFDKIQEDMALAARDMVREEAIWRKKDEEHSVKQEILNVRLEAEARTRERLEMNVDRLELQEREAIQMKIVNDQTQQANISLEKMVASLKMENIQLQKTASRFESECDEAREARQVELSRANLSLEDQRLQSDRAQRHVLEDKERAENHLQEKLNLSNSRTTYLEDKISHLEEKFQIAKAAANAAAQAAYSVKSTAALSPSVSTVPHSDIPEKISPQALRESIIVLQEQLQEREKKIELLEQEMSTFDTEAPTKVKECDIEITWLRELLSVRIGDLEDLIFTVSQPEFDRETVKDAAIRLKANLQMEQQEKERAMAGGQSFPSLHGISNFASPRATQFVAAWGNWRKGRDSSFGSLSEIVSGRSNLTPSEPAATPAQGFFAGLMTPPSPHLRQSPRAYRRTAPTRFSSGQTNHLNRGPPSLSLRQKERQPVDEAPPTAPPLTRKASYDQDAENNTPSRHGFYDNDDNTVDGDVGKRRAGEVPFRSNVEA